MHSVSFSSTGDRVAWVGHDSSISVADASKGMLVSVIRTDFLPFLACLWVSESQLIAAVRWAKYCNSFSLVFFFSLVKFTGSWLLSYAI